MSTEVIVLVILFVTAVVLDLYFVSGLRRVRRLKKKLTDQDGLLRVNRIVIWQQAFFPFIRFKQEEQEPVNRFSFGNAPMFLVSVVSPLGSFLLLSAGLLQLRGDLRVTGSICILLAMAGFGAGLRRLESTPFTVKEIDVLCPRIILPVRWWTLILGLLILSMVFVADPGVDSQTNYVASITWVCSVALGMFTVWNRTILPNTRILEKVKTNRRELCTLLFLLLGTLLLRTIDLSNHPYPWSGDEASIGMKAMEILHGDVTNLFEASWSHQSNWSFVPTAVSEFIFGENILAVRMASGVAGTLAVLFVYLAGREMFNPTIGLLTAGFLATLPLHVHFSRFGVSNIVDSLVSAMMFWLLMKGIRKSDVRYYYTAGAVAGLSIYTYSGTRLVLILAFVTFLFLLIREKGYLATHWKHMLFFAGGALLSALPQAVFFAKYPHIFLGRLGDEGIFLNGWLEAYAAQTGTSTIKILFEQLSRTVMVFIASPASGNFFNSPEPYLSLIGSILFLLGMAYALAHLLDLSCFVLILWFWSVILLGGMLTLNPPAHQRLLMSTPALSLLMALGAYKILEYFQKFHIVKAKWVVPILTVLAAGIAYSNIRFYMFEYRSHMYFASFGGEFAMEVGIMSSNLGKDVQIFVLGEPRVFASFPTLAFVAPNHAYADLHSSQLADFTWDARRHAAFFAILENGWMLEEISQRYPGGQEGRFYRESKPDEILFEYYILSASN